MEAKYLGKNETETRRRQESFKHRIEQPNNGGKIKYIIAR